MSGREQVVCKIIHSMDRFLIHYQAQHGLTNSEVYARASAHFLSWLEERVDPAPMPMRSMPSTAIPYGGYVDTSVKEQLVAFAERGHHIHADVYYTLISMYCDHLGYKDTVPVTCFVSADLLEFITHHDPASLASDSYALATEIEAFMEAFEGGERPAHAWAAPPLTHVERVEVQLSSESLERLMAIKRELSCSLQSLYSHVIEARYTKLGWTERVPVRCIVSTHLLSKCEAYLENKEEVEGRPRTKSELMERATDRFLSWYKSKARPVDWEPRTPHLDGEIFEAYIDPKLIKALGKLPYPTDELLFTSLELYSEEEGIKSGYRELKLGKVPSTGLTVLYLEPEQQEIINFLVVHSRKFKDHSAFYHAAATWWLEQRDKVQGFYDRYVSYQHLTKEEGVLEVKEYIELNVHHRIKHYATLDGQKIRTVYNNAIIDFLDHLMTQMDPKEARVTVSIEHILKEH